MRSAAPVTISNAATGYENQVNSFKNHNGGNQVYKSQFTALVEPIGDFTVDFASTPFHKLKYRLDSVSDSRITVTVNNMPSASFEITNNGTIVNGTAWNKTLQSQAPLASNDTCGTSRFDGDANSLEFVLTAGCEIYVNSLSSLRSTVRLDMTEEQFY